MAISLAKALGVGVPYLNAEPPDLEHAVEIAARIWWVGAPDPIDQFQTLAYLIEDGANSVLIDPGSVLTIAETLAKITEVVPLDQLRWVICQHADPDIASSLPILSEAGLHPAAQLVTEWRAAALLRHYGKSFPLFLLEEHHWRLELSQGRRLEFQLTPYLHFPGAFVTFETGSQVLFSSDIFGGFAPPKLLADATYSGAMRPFHEHYMPSHELLSAGLTRVRQRWPQIAMVAPQHGRIIPGSLVATMFDELLGLECGVFALAEDDTDLNLEMLIKQAGAVRRLTRLLVRSDDLTLLAESFGAELRTVAPVRFVDVAVQSATEGWIRLDPSDEVAVGDAAEPSASTQRLVEFADPDHPAVRVTVEGDLSVGQWDSCREVLEQLAAPLRLMAERALARRSLEQERERQAEIAQHDPLTGLLNRRTLDAATPTAPMAAIMLDIDHFKRVNDSFGHAVGDEVLRRVARVVTEQVRSTDQVIRYGGEEILVLLPHSNVSEASAIAERIRVSLRQVSESPFAESGPGRVTASFGVASTAELEPVAHLVGRADAALYQAKEAGRDRVIAAPLSP